MKTVSASMIRRLILGALIAVVLGWNVVDLQKAAEAGKLPLNDFVEYWAASRVFISGGNPYDASDILAVQRGLGWAESKPLMMWNPPWTLPLLLPICSLSFWTSRGLWFIVNLGFVLVIADRFWRRSGGPASFRWLSWLAAFLFLPAGTALVMGQISPVVLAGLAAFIWGVQKKRWFWAGTAAAGIAVKPHLLYLFWLFLLLWVIKNKKWTVLLGAASMLALLSAIVLLINPSIFVQYYKALNSPSGPGIWQTPTWGMALLMMIPQAGGWARFLPSVLGTAVAIVLWRSWRSSFEWERRFPTISLLSVTTSSFTWMFDWIVLLPVVVLILRRFLARPSRLWWLAASFLLMQPLLIVSQGITKTNFYTIWMPPTLWLLYWLSDREGRLPTSTGSDFIVPSAR